MEDFKDKCEDCDTLYGLKEYLTNTYTIYNHNNKSTGLVKSDLGENIYNYNPLFYEADEVDFYHDMYLKFGEQSVSRLFEAIVNEFALSMGVDIDEVGQCIDNVGSGETSCEEFINHFTGGTSSSSHALTVSSSSTQYARTYSLYSSSYSAINSMVSTYKSKLNLSTSQTSYLKSSLIKGSKYFSDRGYKFRTVSKGILDRFGKYNGRYLLNKMVVTFENSKSNTVPSKILNLTDKIIKTRRNYTNDMSFIDRIYAGNNELSESGDQIKFINISETIYNIGSKLGAYNNKNLIFQRKLVDSLQEYNGSTRIQKKCLSIGGDLAKWAYNVYDDYIEPTLDFGIDLFESIVDAAVDFTECMVYAFVIYPAEVLVDVFTSALETACSAVNIDREACDMTFSGMNHVMQAALNAGEEGIKLLGCLSSSLIKTSTYNTTKLNTLDHIQNWSIIVEEIASFLKYDGFYCFMDNCMTSFNHFINTGDERFYSDYNDHRGYYRRVDASIPDPTNTDQVFDRTGLVFIATDFLHAKMEYNRSKALSRYNPLNSDRLQSYLSSSYYHSRPNVDSTQFQTIDNLGAWGHGNFMNTSSVKELGRLAHAAGDTGVSHHVGGWLSGGHENFEQWSEDHFYSGDLVNFESVKELLNNNDKFTIDEMINGYIIPKYQLNYRIKTVQELLTSSADYTYNKFLEDEALDDINKMLRESNSNTLSSYIEFESNWSVATIVSVLTRSMKDFAERTQSRWALSGVIRTYPNLNGYNGSNAFPYPQTNHPVKSADFDNMQYHHDSCDKTEGCTGWNVKFSEFTKGYGKVSIYAMGNWSRPVVVKNLNDLPNKTVNVNPFNFISGDVCKGFAVRLEYLSGYKPGIYDFGYRISEVKQSYSSYLLRNIELPDINPVPTPIVINSFKW